jgi:CRISPR-associated protein Cas2
MDEIKRYSSEIDLGENIPLDSVDNKEVRDKKYFVLVIYDISENKRRNRMVKILNSYGFRVQKSAFEALLRPSKYKKLLSDIAKIPDSCDSIRVYKILGQGTVEVFGEQFYIESEETVII